jgi:uncharacterized protein (DUF2141 family)
MKKYIVSLALIIIFELISTRCANPITPSGGPKDTIPPNLIFSIPELEQTQFKQQEIVLEFDEFINADKLKSNLIITPLTETKFKQIVKKNRIILRFEEPFSDSTTYTLNFSNGITDITERTPPDNLSLSFSTGTFIDSLMFVGKIKSLLTGSIIKDKFTIALYKATDSLDFVTQKPNYFSKSNDEGQFILKNLRAGKYILIAFNDKNNNLQLDPSQEPHALISDTLRPVSFPDSTQLKFVDLDASPLKFISARPSAQYFDIRYSKPITNYDLQPFQFARIVSDNQVVRIYQDSTSLFDSLRVYVIATDTVNNQTIDTVFVKFNESSREVEDFKIDYSQKTSPNGTIIKATTNKPSLLNRLNLLIPIDTIAELKFKIDSTTNNSNNTRFELYSSFSQTKYNELLDSLIHHYFPDTANIDSIGKAEFNYISRITRSSYKLIINKGQFASIQADSSISETLQGKFYNPENVGSITVNIKTDIKSYEIHLVDSKQNSVAKQSNCNTCIFTSLKPGEYSVRVFIDENNDGSWSPGNILLLKSPEPVINFNEYTDLRANWTIELNYQF